jgi:isocitrate dehydrogenase
MTSRLTIALAPGDGIGPEIMDATLRLFKEANVHDHLDFRPVAMGKSVFDTGNSKGITDEAVRAVEDCGVVFKGPMETPKGGGGKSINVTLRKLFSTYANFRVFKTLPGVQTVFSKAGIHLDFSIVRENIEDTYGGVEHRAVERHDSVQAADLGPGLRPGASLHLPDRQAAGRDEGPLRPQGQHHEDDRRAVS